MSVDPRDAGDESVGLNRTKNRPCLRINLMDLPASILAHPECAFGPGEARVATFTWRRDRSDHFPCLRIDLLNGTFGELKKVLSVKSRSCMRSDLDRAQCLPARGIEGIQRISSSKPNALTVIGDTVDMSYTWKGTILLEDFGVGSPYCSSHKLIFSQWVTGPGVTMSS